VLFFTLAPFPFLAGGSAEPGFPVDDEAEEGGGAVEGPLLGTTEDEDVGDEEEAVDIVLVPGEEVDDDGAAP